jgi:TRAP-type C4-dicarboxylate transport system permease small subunit
MVVALLPDEVVKSMLRIALIDILMFALPFLLYGAYVLATRGTARTAASAGLWQGAPVLWLLVAGGALLLITMATLISFSGGKPGGTYHPPSLQNGVVKPGEID